MQYQGLELGFRKDSNRLLDNKCKEKRLENTFSDDASNVHDSIRGRVGFGDADCRRPNNRIEDT